MEGNRHSSGPSPTRVPGRGRGEGTIFVLVLAALALGWGLWSLRPGESGKGPAADPATGTRPGGAPGPEGSEPPGLGRSFGSRSRPFARSGPDLPGSGGVPWQARLHTNGTLDGDLMRRDATYLRKVVQSNRLKTLLESPAKDTPECGQIVAFVDRKGLPLAATVDLYNIVWATRQYETRVAGLSSSAEKDSMDVVRDLELSDFQRRFQRDYEVDVGPMLEELFALPLQPTVFMGVPSRAFTEGEALLSD